MKVVCLLLISVFLFSCVSTSNDQNVMVYLTPDHKKYPAISPVGQKMMQIYDNDGNLYITYWKLDLDASDTFKQESVFCKDKLSESIFSNRSFDIHNITEGMIKPKLYLEFVNCMKAVGFVLENAKSYYPSGYNLHIYREHTTDGMFMPIGGVIIIERTENDYSKILQLIKRCDLEYRDKYGSPLKEQRSGGFISSSLKLYAEEMGTCATGKPYKIEKTNK